MSARWNDGMPTNGFREKVVQSHETRFLHMNDRWHDFFLILIVRRRREKETKFIQFTSVRVLGVSTPLSTAVTPAVTPFLKGLSCSTESSKGSLATSAVSSCRELEIETFSSCSLGNGVGTVEYNKVLGGEGDVFFERMRVAMRANFD